MRAIIIPGVTDLNKGDQALVWESARLIQDTGVFSDVDLLANGDTPAEKEMLCGQSSRRGFKIVEGILGHPRRGVHPKTSGKLPRLLYTLFMLKNAVADLFFTALYLASARVRLVRFLLSKEKLKKLDELTSYDVFVVKGGGFLHSYGEARDVYVFWYFLFYINLANAFRKKVIVLPNSFGPFRTLGVKFQMKNAFGKRAFLSARERKSSAALGSLLGRKVDVYPDLGFYLKEANRFDSDGLLKDLGVSQTGNLIGITVRPWRFPEARDPQRSWDNYLLSIIGFVEYQLRLGNQVVFFNQSLGPNTNEDDRLAIAEVMKNFDGSDKVFWLDKNLPCDELKSVYSKLDFLIGTRFHSVIFSLTSGVPCGAISYGGNKGDGIMSDMDLKEMVCPISEVDVDKLVSIYEFYMSRKGWVKDRVLEYGISALSMREKLLSELRVFLKS